VAENKDKADKKGFNPIKGVIKGVGGVAGTVGATAGNLADQATQTIAGTFATKAKSGQFEMQSPETLAQEFANYLARKNKGQVETVPIGDNQICLKLKENVLISGYYFFVFAPTADEALTTRLLSPEFQSQKPGAIALLVQEWQPTRLFLEDKLSVFVWKDAVRLGADHTAEDYLGAWLRDYTNFQFEKKDLIEGNDNDQSRSRRASYDSFFTGREEYAELIARSIVANRELESGLAWIFSISGQGGSGKSYLLEQIKRRYASRMLYVFVDHQSSEEANEENLIGLISELASHARADGCPTPNFDKKMTEYRRTLKKRDAEEGSRFGQIKDSFTSVSDSLSKVDYGKLANASKSQSIQRLFNFAESAVNAVNVFGGVGSAAAELGLGIYDRISKEQKAKDEAILGERLIREMTSALIKDFGEFADKQRKHYLFRRIVIVFDTYELIGSLADTWLRTLFLKDPKLQEVEPVVITAGRYEIMRFNTRWSEFQSQLKVIKLGCFSLEETANYVAKMGITDPARVEMIYNLTSGLPLFIHLVVNLSNEQQALTTLKERILEEIEEEYQQAFLDVAVADGFNRETLDLIFGASENKAKLFNRLLQATFVEPQEGRYGFLKEVRKVLGAFNQFSNPKRVEAIKQAVNSL
jgi:hypothetical protein